MHQIITNRLDSDTYKFSMLQAFFHQYPTATGQWRFTCRNKGVKLGFLKDQVREQINALEGIRVSKADSDYLLSLGYFKQDFVQWFVQECKLNPNLVSVQDVDGDLEIEVCGKLIDINLFEVYILAIVNELYFNSIADASRCAKTGDARLTRKIDRLATFPRLGFAEFGTRRRFNKDWQDHVVGRLVEESPNLVGTSNVHLARKYGIKPIGTVAHEWSMAHLGFVDRVEQAQSRALHVWRQEYDQQLGIALSDTFTTDAFLRDFGFSVARAYDGVRHDSGDPFIFGHKMINHYESVGVDPRRKSIVFSDGLDVEKAISIWKEFSGLIGVSFGIGTHFSNDVGLDALNIVMKLMRCNGEHTVKLSDDLGKSMGHYEKQIEVRGAYVY